MRHSNFDFTQEINGFNILEASADTGSVEYFKYLLLNNVHYTERLCNFAISGGNYEIIHAIENNFPNSDFCSDECFVQSIIYHRYSITDWILVNSDFKPNAENAHKAIKAFNYPAFVFIWHLGIVNEEKEKVEEESSNDSLIEENSMHVAARCVNIPILRFLLERENYDWNKKTYMGDFVVSILKICGKTLLNMLLKLFSINKCVIEIKFSIFVK